MRWPSGTGCCTITAPTLLVNAANRANKTATKAAPKKAAAAKAKAQEKLKDPNYFLAEDDEHS